VQWQGLTKNYKFFDIIAFDFITKKRNVEGVVYHHFQEVYITASRHQILTIENQI